MEVSGQRYAPTALTPEKIGNLDPLNTRLGGPQSGSARFEEKRTFFCRRRKSNHDSAIVRLVARRCTD